MSKYNRPERFKEIEASPLSRGYKLRMNRLFREFVGGSFLPFPEVDNHYEQVRSYIIIKFKLNRNPRRYERGKGKKKKHE